MWSTGPGQGTDYCLACLLLERLSVDYEKELKLSFAVRASPQTASAIVILSARALLEHMDVAVLDIEASYDVCRRNSDVKCPTHVNLERLLAQTISSWTAILRLTEAKT